MISRQECMTLILNRVPAFRGPWQVHLNSWKGEQPGLCNDLAAFSRYVADLIRGGQVTDLPEAFSLIEELMVGGDREVREAVATCFLEGLVNYSAAGRIPAASFVPLLGAESRAYCKAWDEFTGARTEGLWDD